MDGKIIRNKLVGNEGERAVSPVIGVILMVAITVILAAVIAAFVLDMGDDIGSGTVNAGVSTDVSNADQEVTVTVDTMGDAEYFVMRGDVDEDDARLDLNGTGDSQTLEEGYPLEGDEGQVNIVAVAGDDETVVTSFEWDWSGFAAISLDDDIGAEDDFDVAVTVGDYEGVYLEVEVEDEDGNVEATYEDGTTEYNEDTEVTISGENDHTVNDEIVATLLDDEDNEIDSERTEVGE